MRFGIILHGFSMVLIAALVFGAGIGATRAQHIMEDYPSVTLQGLDKSVGRTITFEAKVGSTIQYGPLYIKIHACRKAPPMEAPESAAFLQVWEVPPGAQKSEWVFSGWMFASSPALSAMDHPVYDVWVLDCTGRIEPNEEAREAETSQEADQDTLPAADADFFDDSQDVGEEVLDGEAMVGESMTHDNNISPQGGVHDTVPNPAYGDVQQPQSAPGYQVPQQDPYVQPEARMEVIEEGHYPEQPAARDDMPAFDPYHDSIYSPSQGRMVPAPRPQPSPYPQGQDLPPVY